MAIARKSGDLKLLGPDSKSQITMLYEDGKPSKVTSVVISTQHSSDVNQLEKQFLITALEILFSVSISVPST